MEASCHVSLADEEADTGDLGHQQAWKIKPCNNFPPAERFISSTWPMRSIALPILFNHASNKHGGPFCWAVRLGWCLIVTWSASRLPQDLVPPVIKSMHIPAGSCAAATCMAQTDFRRESMPKLYQGWSRRAQIGTLWEQFNQALVT